MHRTMLFALAAAAAGAAAAQSAAPPDPANARATVPALEYRSVFADYRPLAEEKLEAWRQSNEAVKEGGAGHPGHVPKPPAESEPAPKPPAAHEHGGHR